MDEDHFNIKIVALNMPGYKLTTLNVNTNQSIYLRYTLKGAQFFYLTQGFILNYNFYANYIIK